MATVAQDNFFFDNWKYLLAAFVMHAAIAVALTVTISSTRRVTMPATLAIQAVVVDNTQQRLQREREQAEAERREREEAERQRELEAQAEAQRKEEARQDELRQEAAAEQKRKVEQQRQADVRKRQEAERKRVAEIKAKQAEKQKAERDAREQAQREAELKRQLADETERLAAMQGGAMNEYVAQITAKIERNWTRPPTARPGISCELSVRQAPGGIVLSVKIVSCIDDKAVRESIETAVNRSSPLPTPSNARLFQPTLTIYFKPDG